MISRADLKANSRRLLVLSVALRAKLPKVEFLSHLKFAPNELSKATYGAPKRPGADQEPRRISLIICIIRVALLLSLHLLSYSPQIQVPLRLIGKVAISIQLWLWYRWGMQLIWIISLPHVVNNRLTGGRIQRVGCQL